MKRNFSALLLALALLLSLTGTGAAADGALVSGGAYWTEVGFQEANSLFRQAQTGTDADFILVFYSRYCGYSQNLIPSYFQYAEDNGLRVYGLDAFNTLGGGEDSFQPGVSFSGGYPMVFLSVGGRVTVETDVRTLGAFAALLGGPSGEPDGGHGSDGDQGAQESDFVLDEAGTLRSYTGTAATVVIPDYVSGIAENAFQGNTAITAITIPGSCSVSMGAFRGCTALETVTLGEGFPGISEELFRGCHNLRSITLPDSISYIYDDAFADCYRLSAIRLPDQVHSIGHGAFSGCTALKDARLPANLSYIYDNAFYQCTSLTGVQLPAGLKHLGMSAFSGCSALDGTITVPAGITKLPVYAFYGCSALEELILPDSLTVIEDVALQNCTSLRRVTLGKGLTSIGTLAFSGCSALKDIRLPDSLTAIDEFAFSDCASLTDLTVPSGITTLSPGVFEGCLNLTRLSLPQGLTSIGDRAVARCTALKELTIPAGVTRLGASSVAFCSGMERLVFEGSRPDMDPAERPFSGTAARVSFPAEDASWDDLAALQADFPTLDWGTGSTEPIVPEETPAGAAQPAQWAQDEITAAIGAGLIPAPLQSSYDRPITRLEFCTMSMALVKQIKHRTPAQILEGITGVDTIFADTQDENALAAFLIGVVQGNGDGLFLPQGNITRQEAAAMLARTARFLALVDVGDGLDFTDKAQFPSWAVGNIAFISAVFDPVSGKAVMGGTGGGNFSPTAQYTRQEAGCTFLRLYHALGGK